MHVAKAHRNQSPDEVQRRGWSTPPAPGVRLRGRTRMETIIRNGKNGEKVNGQSHKSDKNGHLLAAAQEGSKAGAYERLVAKYAPAARALVPEQVVPFHGDASAIYHNVARGV